MEKLPNLKFNSVRYKRLMSVILAAYAVVMIILKLSFDTLLVEPFFILVLLSFYIGGLLVSLPILIVAELNKINGSYQVSKIRVLAYSFLYFYSYYYIQKRVKSEMLTEPKEQSAHSSL